jgi:hypothetical protein
VERDFHRLVPRWGTPITMYVVGHVHVVAPDTDPSSDFIDETETVSLETFLRREMRPLVENSVREAATTAMQPVQEALLANLQEIVQANFERALERYRGLYASDTASPASGFHQHPPPFAGAPWVESSLLTGLDSFNANLPNTLGMDGDNELESWPQWLQPPDASSYGDVGVGSVEFDLDDYEWATMGELP